MPKNANKIKISKTVILLGFVSCLTDISSESIYPLIPLFLSNVLHAPVTAIGLIEGIAECTASILRVFSGWFSDRIGSRKWLTVSGYFLSALSKPLLSASVVWHHVFAVRFLDRLGKGIRSAPRDALIADVTPSEIRGTAFGFHSAMDTAGAVIGPLIAFFLLKSLDMNYRDIFLYAAIPGFLGVLLLVVFIKEAKKSISAGKSQIPSLRLGMFGKDFKRFLLITAIFSIGNSSDAFLVLKAMRCGISAANILLVFVLFNSIQAIFAMPAGIISDKIGRKNVILAGFLVFALVYLGFGIASKPAHILVLFAFYGMYCALTHGVQKAFASDLIPANIRGTGIGAYSMITGMALFPASLIAGVLWDNINPSAPFFYGALMAIVSAVILGVSFRGKIICNDK